MSIAIVGVPSGDFELPVLNAEGPPGGETNVEDMYVTEVSSYHEGLDGYSGNFLEWAADEEDKAFMDFVTSNVANGREWEVVGENLTTKGFSFDVLVEGHWVHIDSVEAEDAWGNQTIQQSYSADGETFFSLVTTANGHGVTYTATDGNGNVTMSKSYAAGTLIFNGFDRPLSYPDGWLE